MENLFIAGLLFVVGFVLLGSAPQPESEWESFLAQTSPEQVPPAKLGCGTLLLLALLLLALIVGGLWLG